MVLALCSDAATRLNGEPAAHLRRIRDELAQPQVRIAVVGRVSSGKSTLVNALVGWRIAATDAGECTQTVTCYRYGSQLAAIAHLRNGDEVEIATGAADQLQFALPVPAAQLSHVDVRVPAEALRDITLIDSPGISSGDTDRGLSAETHELGSHRLTAVPTPDAVVFVLTQNLRADESELLNEIDGSNDLFPSSVNTVGVLTKADLLNGGGSGAWQAGERLAESIAADNTARFTAVIPVIGLLAEAGLCACLGSHHTAWLAALAEEWGPEDRHVACLSPSMFVNHRSTVAGDQRAELVSILGLAGVRELLTYVDNGVVGVAALRSACRRLSGYDALDTMLVERFRERADALKAARSLSDVTRLAHGALGRKLSGRDRAWLRDRVEAVRFDPRTHRILELEALHRVLARQVDLPREHRDDLVHLVQKGGRPSRGLGAAEWQSFETRATTAGQRAVARVMVRTYSMAVQPLP